MSRSLKEDGRPSDQWYWDDWFSSHDVQSCSFAAQGLWINMLGIMFTSKIRGTLAINGITLNNKMIARRFGKSITEVNKLITELEEARVFDRLDDGMIISRRMYDKSKKKEEISEARSRAGKEGMKSRWKNDNKPITKSDNKNITNITAPTPTPTPTPTSKNSPRKFSEGDVELTKLLIEKMKQNDEKAKVPAEEADGFDKWADQIRLCRERDGRSEEEIKTAIDFSQKDDFWRSNILSTTKLRKHMATLLHRSKHGNGSKGYRVDQAGSNNSQINIKRRERFNQIYKQVQKEFSAAINSAKTQDEVDEIEYEIMEMTESRFRQGEA